MSMALGMKTRNRKIPTFQIDYLIHIQEIKPWPPSQSLRTLRAVLIQWEYGDRNSGVTSQVVPSLGSGSGVGDGRIEFNESFRLPVTLSRELSGKGSNRDTFQKSCIEFNLFEPRRDTTVKGQLLGTAIVDLSDYAATKDTLCVSAAINCKRAYRNTAQPFLFLTIKSIDKIRGNLSSRDPSTRPSPMQKKFFDSVSALMSEEYAEEADTASFTDDDASSHSSLTTTSPAASNRVPLSQNKVSELESVKASSGESEGVPTLTHDLSKSDERNLAVSTASSTGGGSSPLSSTNGKSVLERLTKNTGSSTVQFSSSSGPCEVREENNSLNSIVSFSGPCEVNKEDNSFNSIIGLDNIRHVLPGVGLVTADSNSAEKLDLIDSFYSCVKECAEHEVMVPSTKGTEKYQVNPGGDKCQEEKQQKEIMNGYAEEQPGNIFSQDGTWMDLSLVDASLSPNRDDKLKHVKLVRSSSDSNRSCELVGTSPSIPKNDRKDNKGRLEETRNGAQGSMKNNRRENKGRLEEKRNILSDDKLQQLEQKVKKLEWELTEAAAIEAALYSVVSQHGSSINKVHAPARRLSRFYIHALKQNAQIGRASAARTVVSGLVLVAKACGNDVPRLTFWLSNSILLRSLITGALMEEQLPFSVPVTGKNGSKESSPLKWQYPSTKGEKGAPSECFDYWEDPRALETSLENFEGWIFSRIIESLWWQVFTPHMQSGAAKTIEISVDEENGSFSLELWKMAFRDACERICPVRAEGHECGCLPILSQLIMEQCIARLDVAMFNGILRESVDDIPTDPVSDPIGDAEVLPIPAGKASFGAGAQLKNAIGNWSRWLSDLFDLDDDSTLEDVIDETSDDERSRQGTSLKSFHLLNALSDLMMLPKDLLLSRTVRKEVCPTLAPALIRRVLNMFVPDEFCPEQVPRIVLEALNSEDSFEAEEDMVVNFPCPAAQINYIPPLPADIVGNLRDGSCHSKLARSGSLLLTKSHASDDELDELDSPLSSIYTDSRDNSPLNKPTWTLEEGTRHYATRYQLLRKIWNFSQ